MLIRIFFFWFILDLFMYVIRLMIIVYILFFGNVDLVIVVFGMINKLFLY